jgi:hypothetical protein
MSTNGNVGETLKDLERRLSHIELGTGSGSDTNDERDLNSFKLQILKKLKTIRYVSVK